MLYSFFQLFLVFSIVLSVFDSFGQKQEPFVINLINPVVEKIPMSRLFSHIEYIPLELSDECILGNDLNFYLSGQYIIVTNLFDNVCAFDRNTGKFEKQIGNQGTGKDEYAWMPIFSYGYDEVNDVFFFDDNRQWKAISIESNKSRAQIIKPREARDIKIPDNEKRTGVKIMPRSEGNEGWKIGGIFNPWSLGDGKYVGFVNNSTGDIDVKLVIFDETGKVLKSFPNPLKYDKLSVSSSPINPGQFYNFEGKTFFKELHYNDTVFQVSDEKLVPHIIFETGDKKMPYESMAYVIDHRNKNKIKISFVQETGLYIFFNYHIFHQPDNNEITFSGYYDKDTKKTYVCEAEHGQAGFTDDIKGLFHFNPSFINNKNEFIGKIFPKALLGHKDKLQFETLSESEKSLLLNLSDSDNPIVVIAHLKGSGK